MSSQYNYTNRNSNKSSEGGTNGGGNQNPYPPRRQNVPVRQNAWGQPPTAPPAGTAPPGGQAPMTSSLQQAAAGASYTGPARMQYYSPNPYATYGPQPPQQQPGMHRPVPAGMWQPAPPTSGMNYNPYANPSTSRMSTSSMTYYPNTASAASASQKPPPPPAPTKKKISVITDKTGKVIDLSKEAGAIKQQSSLQAAASGSAVAPTPVATPTKTSETTTTAAPTPASDAGAKLRQAVLERLAADQEAKAQEDAEKARAQKEEQQKLEQVAAEKAEQIRKGKEEQERIQREKQAAEQEVVAEAPAAPPTGRRQQGSLSSLAARLESQGEGKLTISETEPRPRAPVSSLADRLEKHQQNTKGEDGTSSPARVELKPDRSVRTQEVAAVPAPTKAVSEKRPSSRKVYSKDEMLRLKTTDVAYVRPADLPDLTIQLVSVGGGGGGGGGPRRGGQRGGGGGGGGGDWSRGAAPPRQSSDRRVSTGQQEANQWSRGQAPPKPSPQGRGGGGHRGGRGGAPPPLYDGPVAPLVRSDKGWRPQKDTSTFVVAEKTVKSILNKMTLEKFDRLATQMCDIPIVSYDILKMIIHNVYEKAIYEPTFGEMYAELCVRLSQSAGAKSFVQIIESDESPPDGHENEGAKVYRWSNDVNTSDAEIVGPYSSPEECIDAALEDDDDPVERADMELELHSLSISEGKFIKIMKMANVADEDSGKVFYTVFFPVENHEDCGQQLSDIFVTEKDCQTDATKRNSFKRSLLNKCEDEFMKQDIYVDWKKEKAEYEATRTTLTESEQTEKAGELEFRRLKIKKQMLGNIKFIGQLYKKGLLKEKIMRSCVASLLKLKSEDEASKYPEYVDTGDMDLDEEDHEAVQSLFTTIGKTIDLPHASSFMKVCFVKIAKMSNDQALPARSRFMYKDLLELRDNKWTPRRKQEKAKTLDEIRKDVEREERRQAQQSAQANYRGGKGDRRDSHSQRGRGGDYRDNRRGGQGFDSRGSMTRQRSVQKASTDEDGFTQVPVRRISGKSQPAPSDRSGDKPIKILKNPAADQAARGPVGMTEPEPEPRVESQPSRALSREKLERLIDTIRSEYVQDPGNEDELLLSFDELAATPDAALTLVSRNADRLMDCKDAERGAIVAMISLLYERKKLSGEVIQSGMSEVIQFIDSFVIDSPKAYDYLGDMLGELLHVKAVDVEWIASQSETAKPDPSSDAAVKIIAKTMAAVKAEYGVGEVKRLFGGPSDKLVTLLGNEVWDRLAKDNGIV